MNCPECKAKMNANLEITGGCSGHEPDEYCYCDSKDIHVNFICPTFKCKWHSNYMWVQELSCQSSVERFINEAFKVSAHKPFTTKEWWQK